MRKFLWFLLILIIIAVGVYIVVSNRQNPTGQESNTSGNSTTDQQEQDQMPNETGFTPVPPDQQPEVEGDVVVLETNQGEIRIELDRANAPITANNFAYLASNGFYDGVIFHRVVSGFVIQGGDPLGTGTGGPGYTFADEIHVQNQNNTGTIAMANAGPNTNGSQFFINLVDNNFLDTKHTVFGRVVEGLDVVNAIAQVATGAADRPLQDVIIEKAYIAN